MLILREVLRWQATEVAELLDTTVASVNSALQRARATLAQRPRRPPRSRWTRSSESSWPATSTPFERYDIDSLVALLREDATQSMPPYDALAARSPTRSALVLGPGAACRGSRLVPTAGTAAPRSGSTGPAAGGGHEPWSLQVLELSAGRIVEFSFFLDTSLFPLFGLPLRLDRYMPIAW